MEIIRKTIENDEEYLRQISSEISFDDKSYLDEIKLLERFCNETECFALAAVQIGVPKRIVYLKNTKLGVPLDDINYNESRVLINPVVISKKWKTQFWEYCLSCPYTCLVARPYEMVVKYYDINGLEHEERFEGFETTVLSHELDHLDGILHIDIAEETLELNDEQRKEIRKKHPYEIISKTCEYKK